MGYDANGNWEWTSKENVSWDIPKVGGLTLAGRSTSQEADLKLTYSSGLFEVHAAALVSYTGHVSKERIEDVSIGISGIKGFDVKLTYNGKEVLLEVGRKVNLLDLADASHLKDDIANLLKNIPNLPINEKMLTPGLVQAVNLYIPNLKNIYYDQVALDAMFDAAYAAGVKDYGWPADPINCFPANTQIQTSPTTSTAISTLRVGDIVMALDPRADNGRGALVPKRVKRLYRNTTTEWIRLRWFDGKEREFITTPGHHFLDQFGQFPTIAEMVRNARTTVVLASGALAEVTAERITYSAQTAHIFERATSRHVFAGDGSSLDWKRSLRNILRWSESHIIKRVQKGKGRADVWKWQEISRI